MERERLELLLAPYLGETRLSELQIEHISIYIDLLVKWNAKMNLTAVRDPDEMVRRHFGESLFAARQLLEPDSSITVADVGSGAGFPGIPLKIHASNLRVTLIEAHGKKATFLREVIRVSRLTYINVFQGRAEDWKNSADLVVLRAVEKFETVLPAAASLVAPNGRLGLLIGSSQLPMAKQLLPGLWADPAEIPESGQRVLQTWSKS